MNKNEASESLKFNIQLFGDTADNDSDESDNDESVNTDNAGSDEVKFVDGAPEDNNEGDDESTQLDNEKKITTKAFSERLKREKQKIEQDAEAKRKVDMDKIAVARGFNSWKELEEFDESERLEKMGIQDASGFSKYVNDAIDKNPIVKEAQRVLEVQKAKEQEAILRDAIAEISKIDPDIKTIDDLIHLENYDEFYEKVDKGYSLPDAYKLVAYDKINSKTVTSVTQNVLTNIDSKNHMKATNGTKTKDVVVPEDVMAMYKRNMPNMSDADIRKSYAKHKGGNIDE